MKLISLSIVLILFVFTSKAKPSVSEKQTLTNVANSNTACAIMAQGVLAEINQTDYLRFPQQIPPTGLGIDDNTLANNELLIYPNPNNGEFTITYNFKSNSVINIINNLGQVVKNITPNESQTTVNLNNIASGIYTVFIINDNSAIVSSKLIIQ
jgi:hypothetical protein